MTGRTHRAIGVAATTATCAAAHWPLLACAVTIYAAHLASPLPDKLEKPLRLEHREGTHWLITGFIVALLAGIGIAEAMSLAPRGVATALPWLPSAVAVGSAIGWWMHSCADACTIDNGGIALLAPFVKRGFHLVPVSWRIRVFDVVRDRNGKVISRSPSRGDGQWRVLAHALTAMVLVATVLSTPLLH